MSKVADFRPATRNANQHTARGLAALQDSMRRVGYTEPMVAAANCEILSGSARLDTVADVFGVEVEPLIIHSDGTRPVIHIRDDVPNAHTKIAQRIALSANRVHELDWLPDVEVLAGLDADVLDGLWTADELSDLGQQWADEHKPAQEDPGAQIDKAEELQAKWNVKPGDLWQLGAHRLLCGDCRKPETWDRLLGGGKANGVFTSPPYAEQRKEQYGGTPASEYVAWWEAVQANVRAHLAQDGSFFVNIKPNALNLDRELYVFDLVVAMVRQYDWHFSEEFCWRKPGIPQQVVKRFKNQFEPVYHFTLGEWKFRPEAVMHESERVPVPMGPGKAGDTNAAKRQGKMSAVARNAVDPGFAYPGNCLPSFQDVTQIFGHPAIFPVGLPDFFIRAYSDAGDVWVDPFCGSGTTLVAAHNNKRRGMGIEMLPKYCAVILERMSSLGIEPVLIPSMQESSRNVES